MLVQSPSVPALGALWVWWNCHHVDAAPRFARLELGKADCVGKVVFQEYVSKILVQVSRV